MVRRRAAGQSVRSNLVTRLLAAIIFHYNNFIFILIVFFFSLLFQRFDQLQPQWKQVRQVAETKCERLPPGDQCEEGGLRYTHHTGVRSRRTHHY